MNKLALISILFTILLVQSTFSRTVEIEVHGMTCAFCVDSLERKFKGMDSVSKVDISLKLKIIRLETDENAPSMEDIKKAVLDTGFKPFKIKVISK
ncbi:MAG: hypothetical protein COB99_00025 [Sulfurimonas sp.]|nr:MAG: hypothetical protein COB99_00025 [Sulfurimonas sp.]